MQEAIPYRRTCLPRIPLHQSPVLRIQNTIDTVAKTTTNGIESTVINGRDLKKMVEENAAVVLEIKGCCMGHVIKRLLQTQGANPTVYEVEEDELTRVAALGLHHQDGEEGRRLHLPAAFIGGRWIGGLDRIIAAHISGELTPWLKQAGALWL